MKLPSNFKPSKQQKNAYELIESSNKSIFIFGPAGSGKSSFIEYFRKKTKKTNITLTSTGLAAVLIEGQTIHSFFQLPPRLLLKNDDEVKIVNKRKSQIKNLEILIIDEISTVRSDVLHSIDRLLKKYRDNNEPFGGLQIMFVGDFFQIAPIGPKTINASQAFENDYESIWFFDCESYKTLDPECCKFDHIHRQKDKTLKDNLALIRENTFGRLTGEYFNKRVINELGYLINNTKIKVPHTAIALCPTNHMVDDYNKNYLKQIKSSSYTYIGKKDNFKETEMPTDMHLVLKEKARVMMISNDSAGRWVNGTFAIITTLTKNEIKIKIPKGKNYSKEFSVDKETWHKYDYRVKKNDKSESSKPIYEAHIVGTFEQYPIRVARATTIHKSQGQTFDNVLVDFGAGAFTHGQAYVALSRTRTYEGLFLKKPLLQSDVQFDKKVIEYYQRHFEISLFENVPTESIEEIVPF